MKKLLLFWVLLCASLACAQVNIVNTPQTPDHININPQSVTLTTNQSQAFQAVVINSDGTQGADVTQWCTPWSSTSGSVATFNNPLSSVASTVGNGTTTISCTYSQNPLLAVNAATLIVGNTPVIQFPSCATPPCVLAPGVNGSIYTVAPFSATGGTPPYTWNISVGSLPSGLNLSSTGCGTATNCQIVGTPTLNNTYVFTVRVQDSLASASTVQAQITVSSTCPNGGVYNPPLTYCSPTNIVTNGGVEVWPNSPPAALLGLTGVGNSAIDCWQTIATNCWTDWRLSDFTTAPIGGRTPSSGDSNPWMVPVSGTYYGHYIKGGGGACWWKFTPPAAPVNLGCFTTASDGTSFDPDSNDASRFQAGTFYSFGTITSPSAYVPYTLNQYTVNSLAANPWTSANITHTTLLDPTGNTDPCNGLGSTNTPLWNKYMWGNAPGDFAGVNDSTGAGKGQYVTGYRYQQDQGWIAVVFDGSATVGQRCTYVNTLTGQISIHGAAPIQMSGWGPLPVSTNSPSVGLNSTGGTFGCNGTNNFAFTYTLVNTLTGNGVGETPLSPPTPRNGVSGTTCSFSIAAPATVSQPHLSSVTPTGYNTYYCAGSISTTCNQANPQNWTLLSNGSNPAGNLAQPVITSAVCAVNTGSTSYTYFVIAVNSGGTSIPSAAFATPSTCPAKVTGTNKNTITWNAVTNVTGTGSGYWLCRDVLTGCYFTTSTSFTDTGASLKVGYVQTSLINNNETVTSPTGFAVSNLPSTGAPYVNTAGTTIHGTKLLRNGSILNFSFSNGICSNCSAQVDLTNGNNVTLAVFASANADVVPKGEHVSYQSNKVMSAGTTGGGGVVNQVMYTFNDNPTTMQNSAFYLVPGCNSSGCTGGLGAGVADEHSSYPESSDGDVLFGSTYNNSFALPTQLWDGEILGWQTNGVAANPYRIAKNYTTGQNGFYSQGIAQCSIDGKYCMWESDMCRNVNGALACGTGTGSGTVGVGCVNGASSSCGPITNVRTDVYINNIP